MLELEYVKFTEAPPFVNLSSKNRLNDEEMQKVNRFLKDTFATVLQSQCITYKEKNKPETFCIPDFICSHKEAVWVIDTKKIPANEKKMSIYQQLIRFILDDKKDNRIIYTEHLYMLLIQDL